MDLPLNATWAENLLPSQRINTLDHPSVHQLLAVIKSQMTKSPVEVVNVHAPQGHSKRNEDLGGVW